MQSSSFSNPKGAVSECSENNIKLSECKMDIFRDVQTYGLGASREEISDEMDLILELMNVRTVCRYRYAQQKDTHYVRAKNANFTSTQSTKNNVQPWVLWLGTSTFQPCSQFPMRLLNVEFFFNAFWFSSSLGLSFKKQSITRGSHFTYTWCYIPLHCVTSGQQSCFSDFPDTRSVYSPFLAYQLLQYVTRF